MDEAARRRLVKRLLIPLPEAEARLQIIQNLLGKEKNDLRSHRQFFTILFFDERCLVYTSPAN